MEKHQKPQGGLTGQPDILIADLDPAGDLGGSLHDLLRHFAGEKIRVRCISSGGLSGSGGGSCGISTESFGNPDLIFLILPRNQMNRLSGILSSLGRESSGQPVVLVSEGCEPDEVIESFEIGVSDFLTPPLREIDVLPRMWRLLKHARESRTLTHTLKKKLGLKQLIGRSPAFIRMVNTIPVIAKSDVSIHLSGETGTGKELCARAIHYLGPRAGKPFLPVNCGAIPADLMENELFGHVRGAFTGATLLHGGLIHEADGGTLLLDEIDCLPLSAQVKLLRFVQEKEYRQLGSTKVHRADVRIIAATNTDLARAVRDGTFRQDLFYRLSIIHLALPPLRERPDDVPLLARHFLAECADEMQREVADFTPEAMDGLCRYGWPGNVRELQNVVKRAVVLSTGSLIEAEGLALPHWEAAGTSESFRAKKARVVAEFEKRYMQDLLQKYHGNISQAAREAQKNRRAFWELIRKYDLDARQFKHPSP